MAARKRRRRCRRQTSGTKRTSFWSSRIRTTKAQPPLTLRGRWMRASASPWYSERMAAAEPTKQAVSKRRRWEPSAKLRRDAHWPRWGSQVSGFSVEWKGYGKSRRAAVTGQLGPRHGPRAIGAPGEVDPARSDIDVFARNLRWRGSRRSSSRRRAGDGGVRHRG